MYITENLTPDARIGSELEKLAYAGLCAFVLSLPWGSDGTMVGGLVLANLIVSAPVGLAMLRLFVVKKVRRFCPIHTLLLAFTAWVAASLMWTVDSESTVTRLGTYTGLLMFVALIWEFAATKARIQGLMVSYVLGAGIASVATIYNYATGRTVAMQKMGGEWETYRYSVDGVNANELALILALSIPMALYLLTTNKNRWLQVLCWVQVIAGFTAILITATRGGLFAVIVGVVMMSGPTLSRMSRIQRRIAVIACVALVSCMVFVVPKTSVDRFRSTGKELTQGTLTHRTVIWAAGLEVFRDHPFLGVGAGAYGRATTKIVDIPFIAHNTFISVLVELGVVGALLLLLLLASMLYSALRLQYLEKRLWLALLTTWVIGACSVTWENRKITWLLFGLVAAQAYAKNKRVFRLGRRPLVYKTQGRELRPSPAPTAVTT